MLGFNTFKLPDLRGRFPLGRLNMDNGDLVPNKDDNGATNIDSGGGTPDISETSRVRDIAARNLGNADGTEQRTLSDTNLPDHEHDLIGDQGTQFYLTNNNNTTPSDSGAFLGNGASAPSSGQYLNVTGGLYGVGSTSQPFNITNPFQTLNYIIYAGKVVL